MQAIHDAAGRVAMGAGEVFIAGGVESMLRIPMTGFNPMPNPKLSESSPGGVHFDGHHRRERRKEV